MFFGVSHVDVPSRDLERASRFWCDGLGFVAKKRGDGFVDVDTGSMALRIFLTQTTKAPAAIRLAVFDVDAAARQIAEVGGSLLYETSRTAALELAATCADPDGNQIIVWRDLSEDEYDFVPELPMTLTWDDDASHLLKSLLGHVPALFRGLARRKVTRNAEYVASTAGQPRVTRDTVVRAYIISNAKITRDRVRKPLISHGFNPEQYPEEFDA